MNIWHRADPRRINPESFLACIEISKGSKNKYELEKYSGGLILDRILYTATHYPQNYGFIPRTYAGDGDPLDVLVICSEPIVPLALVDCYPIGMLEMTDQGQVDTKIIAIAKNDPVFNSFVDIKQVPDHILQEIRHFFIVYKEHKHTLKNSMVRKWPLKLSPHALRNMAKYFQINNGKI